MIDSIMPILTAKLVVVRTGIVAIKAAWVCVRAGITTFALTGKPALAGLNELFTGMYYTCREELVDKSKLQVDSFCSLVKSNQHLDLTGIIGLVNTVHNGIINREDDAWLAHIDWSRRPDDPTSTQSIVEFLDKLGAWAPKEKASEEA